MKAKQYEMILGMFERFNMGTLSQQMEEIASANHFSRLSASPLIFFARILKSKDLTSIDFMHTTPIEISIAIESIRKKLTGDVKGTIISNMLYIARNITIHKVNTNDTVCLNPLMLEPTSYVVDKETVILSEITNRVTDRLGIVCMLTSDERGSIVVSVDLKGRELTHVVPFSRSFVILSDLYIESLLVYIMREIYLSIELGTVVGMPTIGKAEISKLLKNLTIVGF